MRISDWSSDVCSSDLLVGNTDGGERRARFGKFVRFRRTQISQRACGAPAAERTGHPVLVHAQRCHQIGLLCDVREIGRASGRESVCQYVEIGVVAVSLKKTKEK